MINQLLDTSNIETIKPDTFSFLITKMLTYIVLAARISLRQASFGMVRHAHHGCSGHRCAGKSAPVFFIRLIQSSILQGYSASKNRKKVQVTVELNLHFKNYRFIKDNNRQKRLFYFHLFQDF